MMITTACHLTTDHESKRSVPDNPDVAFPQICGDIIYDGGGGGTAAAAGWRWWRPEG